MKNITLTTNIKSYQWDELPADLQELVTIAKEQTYNAYCPYSNFHVGAALLLEDGTVVRGANQENAAYPSGICAERSALFAAGAVYPDNPVKTLAIAASSNGAFTPEPVSPCGACRQVMIESERRYGGKMKVVLYGAKETYVIESAAELLPYIFVDDILKG